MTNIVDKIVENVLNEAAKHEVGDWIYQGGSDYEAFGLIIAQQVNGGSKAIVFTSFDGSTAGKPAIKSTKNWYPPAQKIKESDVPDKIKKKIMDKKNSM